MKHKLNYTTEVGSKLTTLFIYLFINFSFLESETTAGSTYLAAGSFVFA